MYIKFFCFLLCFLKKLSLLQEKKLVTINRTWFHINYYINLMRIYIIQFWYKIQIVRKVNHWLIIRYGLGFKSYFWDLNHASYMLTIIFFHVHRKVKDTEKTKNFETCCYIFFLIYNNWQQMYKKILIDQNLDYVL